jgi:hypothetical protein
MKKIYDHISHTYQVDPSLIVLTRNNDVIRLSDTPLKINYQPSEILGTPSCAVGRCAFCY